MGSKKRRPNKKYTQEDSPKLVSFVDSSNKIHDNKYDYSKSIYVNNRTNLIIICPIHGDFKKRPHTHIYRKQGCPECMKHQKSKQFRKTTDEFVAEASKIHNNLYNYSKTIYGKNGYQHKVIIICEKHGEFQQLPKAHLQGQGCPVCKSSKGEIKIREFLNQNNISFIEQYKFGDCYNNRPLPFDFYIEGKNILIEYDGKQHFSEELLFYSDRLIENDKIKKEYCLLNGIKLISIPYWEFDNINKVLTKELNL